MKKISYFKSQNYPIVSFSYSFICENISYQFLDSERQGNIEREMFSYATLLYLFLKNKSPRPTTSMLLGDSRIYSD